MYALGFVAGEHWDYRDGDDGASISSSETTESSESFPEENYNLGADLPKAVLEVFAKENFPIIILLPYLNYSFEKYLSVKLRKKQL